MVSFGSRDTIKPKQRIYPSISLGQVNLLLSELIHLAVTLFDEDAVASHAVSHAHGELGGHGLRVQVH